MPAKAGIHDLAVQPKIIYLAFRTEVVDAGLRRHDGFVDRHGTRSKSFLVLFFKKEPLLFYTSNNVYFFITCASKRSIKRHHRFIALRKVFVLPNGLA